MPSAYLLVSHGSRDPRPQVAMEQLARLIANQAQRVEAASRKKLSNARRNTLQHNSQVSASAQMLALPMFEPLVGIACLELSSKSLHEQIKKFGDLALARRCDRIQVVPLFLIPGVHVMADIPEQVAIAQQALGQELQIDLRPHLGTHPNLLHLLATQLANTNETDAWILLAHGSRRAGSKQQVETMVKRLSKLGSQTAVLNTVSRAEVWHCLPKTRVVVSAYWAVPPGLESRVQELVGAGHRQIGILPYFLFHGGITDAIAQLIEQLKLQFPNACLQMAEPLGASAELANLIWDLIEE